MYMSVILSEKHMEGTQKAHRRHTEGTQKAHGRHTEGIKKATQKAH
jgi:hypothetical protein